ncbi:MAG: hypothetical protein GT601_17835 [Acidaminobacter sp.]|uniref:hypothetical protein n=1 Tax=Acidaminobacter sp. TaxID=1872102 RepID=UPI00138487C8|nr:hypothetical protein [Acidaminobacter sp.]MZQ99531.1 hypothetical protein [Acidaminobacter sp.]
MCLRKIGLLLLMAILILGMMPAGYAVTDRDGNVEAGVEEAPRTWFATANRRTS